MWARRAARNVVTPHSKVIFRHYSLDPTRLLPQTETAQRIHLVPMLCVGMPSWTLRRPAPRLPRRAWMTAFPRRAWERAGSSVVVCGENCRFSGTLSYPRSSWLNTFRSPGPIAPTSEAKRQWQPLPATISPPSSSPAGTSLSSHGCVFRRWFATRGRPWELIVVDNGSTDGTAAYLSGVRDMAASAGHGHQQLQEHRLSSRHQPGAEGGTGRLPGAAE